MRAGYKLAWYFSVVSAAWRQPRSPGPSRRKAPSLPVDPLDSTPVWGFFLSAWVQGRPRKENCKPSWLLNPLPPPLPTHIRAGGTGGQLDSKTTSGLSLPWLSNLLPPPLPTHIRAGGTGGQPDSKTTRPAAHRVFPIHCPRPSPKQST